MAPKTQVSKTMDRLMKLQGAVLERKNIHANVIASMSPSFNFIFGKGHGLPEGYSMLLYGPPRGGKSVICNIMTGWTHQADPEAIVVKFNTEFRENAQADSDQLKMYGIDESRLMSYEVNQPDQIFDVIEKNLAAEAQEGAKIKLVIIDSLNSMQGRRGMNADSVMVQQVGDQALTIQEGLRRILPIQRKYGFALILTSHIRAQMDTKTGASSTVFQSYSTAVRPAVSYGTQHHCEYYVYVKPVGGKDGKQDLLGNLLENSSSVDINDNVEKTAHRISVKMMDSSLGPKQREGEFTFDYTHGVINTHEEVFRLGVARGVIDRPNNLTYAVGDKKWTGKPAMLSALQNDPKLCTDILTELRRRDLAGEWDHEMELPPAPEPELEKTT